MASKKQKKHNISPISNPKIAKWPKHCSGSLLLASFRAREERGQGQRTKPFPLQTFECKEHGNNERVVDDRSRETVLCAAAALERASGSSSSGAWGRRGRRRSMRKPELCLGFISSSCVHKDEQCPEPGMMAMARLSSSPPRRILLLTLLVFLLAFVPFSAGQMVWNYLFSSWFSFFGFWFCFFGFWRDIFARIWRMMTRNHI